MSFASSGQGSYFAFNHYIDSTSANRAVGYAMLNQATGAIVWASILPGSVNLAIEPMN